ncbi:hypothetical protein NDU88_004981 [Pleurodeles waltl]|uniref:Secreted protein n=1 Tax=Pleurodeles waltl TaxID=8319 RepID=A0AAV7SKH8_PLEWA|nr:hypothetical protein NDU88_004981 [Pleurodeles waltl]
MHRNSCSPQLLLLCSALLPPRVLMSSNQWRRLRHNTPDEAQNILSPSTDQLLQAECTAVGVTEKENSISCRLGFE